MPSIDPRTGLSLDKAILRPLEDNLPQCGLTDNLRELIPALPYIGTSGLLTYFGEFVEKAKHLVHNAVCDMLAKQRGGEAHETLQLLLDLSIHELAEREFTVKDVIVGGKEIEVKTTIYQFSEDDLVNFNRKRSEGLELVTYDGIELGQLTHEIRGKTKTFTLSELVEDLRRYIKLNKSERVEWGSALEKFKDLYQKTLEMGIGLSDSDINIESEKRNLPNLIDVERWYRMLENHEQRKGKSMREIFRNYVSANVPIKDKERIISEKSKPKVKAQEAWNNLRENLEIEPNETIGIHVPSGFTPSLSKGTFQQFSEPIVGKLGNRPFENKDNFKFSGDKVGRKAFRKREERSSRFDKIIAEQFLEFSNIMLEKEINKNQITENRKFLNVRVDVDNKQLRNIDDFLDYFSTTKASTSMSNCTMLAVRAEKWFSSISKSENIETQFALSDSMRIRLMSSQWGRHWQSIQLVPVAIYHMIPNSFFHQDGKGGMYQLGNYLGRGMVLLKSVPQRWVKTQEENMIGSSSCISAALMKIEGSSWEFDDMVRSIFLHWTLSLTTNPSDKAIVKSICSWSDRVDVKMLPLEFSKKGLKPARGAIVHVFWYYWLKRAKKLSNTPQGFYTDARTEMVNGRPVFKTPETVTSGIFSEVSAGVERREVEMKLYSLFSRNFESMERGYAYIQDELLEKHKEVVKRFSKPSISKVSELFSTALSEILDDNRFGSNNYGVALNLILGYIAAKEDRSRNEKEGISGWGDYIELSKSLLARLRKTKGMSEEEGKAGDWAVVDYQDKFLLSEMIALNRMGFDSSYLTYTVVVGLSRERLIEETDMVMNVVLKFKDKDTKYRHFEMTSE